MYDGVKAMIEAEKKIQANDMMGRTICGSHLKTPDSIIGRPLFPEDCKSLLSKCLTPDVWNDLKNEKDKYDVSFKQCILSGC